MIPVVIDSGPEENCDFTGKKISNKEPRIILLNDFTLKSSETHQISDKLEYPMTGTNKELQSGLKYYHSSESHCEACHQSNECIMSLDNSNKVSSICFGCINDFTKIAKRLVSEIDDYYYDWYDSGLAITKGNQGKTCLITGEIIESEYSFELGHSPTQKYVRLKKIDELKEEIYRTGNLLMSHYTRGDRCFLCHDRVKSECFSLSDATIHEKCLEDLREDVDKAVDEHTAMIVSRAL
jgi:hypothetical protein